MGYTPILRAELFGNVDVFVLLKEAGANFFLIKVKVKKYPYYAIIWVLTLKCFMKYTYNADDITYF